MFLLSKQPLPRKVMVHSKPLAAPPRLFSLPRHSAQGPVVATTACSCRAKSCTTPAHLVPGELQSSPVTQCDCCSCQLRGVHPPLEGWGRPHNSDSGRVAPTENWKHHRVGGRGYQHTPSPTCMSCKQHHIPSTMKKPEPTSFRQKSCVLSS